MASALAYKFHLKKESDWKAASSAACRNLRANKLIWFILRLDIITAMPTISICLVASRPSPATSPTPCTTSSTGATTATAGTRTRRPAKTPGSAADDSFDCGSTFAGERSPDGARVREQRSIFNWWPGPRPDVAYFAHKAESDTFDVVGIEPRPARLVRVGDHVPIPPSTPTWRNTAITSRGGRASPPSHGSPKGTRPAGGDAVTARTMAPMRGSKPRGRATPPPVDTHQLASHRGLWRGARNRPRRRRPSSPTPSEVEEQMSV